MLEDRVPDDVSFAALEESAAREKQLASSGRELAATLGRLREERRSEIRAAIPVDKVEAYTKLQERARSRFTEVTNARRHTTESLNHTAQMRKQILRETKDALAQLGVDGRKIEQIQKKYSAQARSLVEDAFGTREEAPYVEAGPSPTSADLSGFQRIVPPYSDQWGYQYVSGTAGRPDAHHAEYRPTAEIYTRTMTSIVYASNSDINIAYALSEMRFLYRMPSAGQIDVLPTMYAVFSGYDGRLEDEWGFSDADVQQYTRIYLRVVLPSGGSESQATLLDLRKGRNDEGEWSGTVARDEYRYPRLLLPNTYPAGQTVMCAIGIYDLSTFWVDDMTCSTRTWNRWLVKEIFVRSTGGP